MNEIDEEGEKRGEHVIKFRLGSVRRIQRICEVARRDLYT